MFANNFRRLLVRCLLVSTPLVYGTYWYLTPAEGADPPIRLSMGEAASLMGGQGACSPGNPDCRCDALTCQPTNCPSSTATLVCTNDGAGHCHMIYHDPDHRHCGIQSTDPAHKKGCGQSTQNHDCAVYRQSIVPPGGCSVIPEPCVAHVSAVVLYCGDPAVYCTQN